MTVHRLAPPARCPSCDRLVRTYLVSDPDTPVYACGSTPYKLVCVAPWRKPPLWEANLETLTVQDTIELAALIVQVPLGIGPAIGLCTVIGCDQTAIDGSCMEHYGGELV